MFRLFILFITSLFLFGATNKVSAQGIPEDNTVAMIRSNYLYQFAMNNNWPADTKKGKFTVGIVGSQDVFEYMSAKYGTKPIGSQTLDILPISELPPNGIIHILFIDKSKKGDLPKYLRELKDKSTLIVTNWEGALGAGSHINFKNIDGSIRFELSKLSMEDKKITPGLKILQWAIQ